MSCFSPQYKVFPWEKEPATIKEKERKNELQTAKVGQFMGPGIEGASSQSITPSSVFAGETGTENTPEPPHPPPPPPPPSQTTVIFLK